MANWIRSPKLRWFVNPRWVDYAFEKTKETKSQWNSYYGSNNKIFNSRGLNQDDPGYRSQLVGGSCTLCDVISNCDWDIVASWLCKAAQYYNTTGCSCVNGFCGDCGSILDGGFVSNNCNTDTYTCGFECPTVTADELTCACYTPPECATNDKGKYVLSIYGGLVPASSSDALCDPCIPGDCNRYRPCPCNTGANPSEGGGSCTFIEYDAVCPSTCCVPGEPDCVECPQGSGLWVPEDLCCETCPPDDCNPFGYPMPPSYCASCEYCNVDPDSPQCADCCRCSSSSPYIDCEDYNEICGPNPPQECADASSNCYQCGSSYIPIWFECEEVDPCPNPFNPDCETGEEIVCYDYNTNDPIYYNASNLGATVIINHDNPATGVAYSYGNVATLCEVPDSLQLCVYLVTSGGEKTKLTYNTDFTINEAAATVTLLGSVSVSGFTQLRFERCSDDKKMFLTFSEGAKLSATDVNASLHQLLFLIQEKEFAANSYTQVQNAASVKAAITFIHSSTKIAATCAANVIDTNGLLAASVDESLTFNLAASAGGQGTTTLLLDEDQDTSPAAATNTIAIGVRGAAATATLTVADGDANVTTDELDEITLISTDGTSKKYVVVDDNATTVTTGTVLAEGSDYGSGVLGAGAAQIGGIAVAINTTGTLAKQNALLVQLKAAIEHANGHNGKITVSSVPTEANGNQAITLTQAVAGSNGNTAITETLDDVTKTDFASGGLSDTAVRDLIVKAINNVADSKIAYATSGNGQNGITGITASNGSSGTQINLTATNAGFAGNATDVVVDVGTNGVEMVNVSTATNNDFTGGKDFTSSEFDDFTFTLKALKSDGSSTDKTYVFDDDNAGATGTLDGSNVRIQLHGLSQMSELTQQVERAIINTGHTNGHGTELTTSRSTNTLPLDTLLVKQSLPGAAGNFTSLAHSVELNARMFQGVSVWNFQYGQDYNTNDPIITFDPPTSLPVNFDLSTTNQHDVLTWDGQGSFVGSDPSVVAGNMQLDNLSNVDFTSTSSGDFLYYSGDKWVNSDFSSLVNSVVNVFDFSDWVSYQTSVDGKLDDYYYSQADTVVDTKWGNSNANVLNVPKDLVPNAITSFGLGYYAAEQQIADQVVSSNTTSSIQTFVTQKINDIVQTGGTVLSNIRWEIGRGEGRNITGVASSFNYPRPFFDIEHFDILDHGVAGNVLDDSSDPPRSANSDISYFRNWASAGAGGKNKLYVNNIDSFKYSGAKSQAFPLGPQNTGTGKPSTDRYLTSLRSIVTKNNWGTALGYTEVHPLTNYPNTEGAGGSTSYLEFMGGDEIIYGSYAYDATSGSAVNVPSVVTYYLSHLWDATAGAPSHIVWQGNMEGLGAISDTSDYRYGIPTTTRTYLNSNDGKNWFYWRWHVTGFDSDQGGSASNSQVNFYEDLSYYSPFEPSKLALDGNAGDNAKYTILPASGSWTNASTGIDYNSEDPDVSAAKGGSYSIKIDANSVFSGLEPFIGDVYDEYVFEVGLDTDARVTTSGGCTDSRCYEVVANIEKYTDGCTSGELDCFRIGSGGTNSAGSGYHVYPTDFNANVVKAWDNYPYHKLGVEIRNKTGASFDLVLKVPRMKRIGYLDVHKSITTAGGDTNYRQLALDWLADYDPTDWDDTTANAPSPEDSGASSASNLPPELQDMKLNRDVDDGSAAAFSLETAVQFLRLGIPANIRVSCYTISTPQTGVFSE